MPQARKRHSLTSSQRTSNRSLSPNRGGLHKRISKREGSGGAASDSEEEGGCGREEDEWNGTHNNNNNNNNSNNNNNNSKQDDKSEEDAGDSKDGGGKRQSLKTRRTNAQLMSSNSELSESVQKLVVLSDSDVSLFHSLISKIDQYLMVATFPLLLLFIPQALILFHEH
jgi:site-specific DNA-cytosine methylase